MRREFRQLVRKYFNLYVKKFPEAGSFLGMQRYDGKWSDQSANARLKNIEFFNIYLKKFENMNLPRSKAPGRARANPEKLSKKDELERKLIIHNLRITIFYLKELKLWQSDPDILQTIGLIIFLLLNRETTPFYKKIEKINLALQGIPLLLKQIKTSVVKPYKLWTEMAIESCRELKFFLNELKHIRVKKELKENFLKNIDWAVQAIDEYKEFLKKVLLPKSINKYNVGKNKFIKLIKLRELDLDIEEMLELGKKTLLKDKKELKKIAKAINPNLTVNSVRDLSLNGVKEIKDKIEKKHPRDFKKIIDQYKKITLKAKKFILNRGLMKIPINERIIIKETPSFLIHTMPFAAYFPPPKFFKEKTGIYLITPVEQKKFLKKHNYAAILNTSIHEAYPGHHLQFISASKNPSLVRTLFMVNEEIMATETVEGWAHYCEEYMKDIGFSNTNEIKFIQIFEEIWRAIRVIIDIKLHFGQMSFQQAVKFLMKETGFEKKDALAEIKWCTKTPSYQLSYLVGKYLIKKLKKEIQEKMGKKYSDKFFHEVILNAGSIPIKYLKEEFKIQALKFPKKDKD